MKAASPVHSIQSLYSLLERGETQEYIGEPVSQLQHALQAAQLAQDAGAGESLVLAALLHDIGHVCDPSAEQMPGLGARHHERLGARAVRDAGLSEDVAGLIELHVDAKRYLAAKTTGYLEKLTPASQQTLKWQGGPMSDAECLAFEALPNCRQALQLRAWDEAAKSPDRQVQPLESYQAMLQRNRRSPLDDVHLQAFRDTGFLHLPGWYGAADMQRILASMEDLQCRPEEAGKWMQYFERNAAGERQLCRIENFLDYEDCFSRVCRGEATLNLLSQLMEEPAVLFKEKVNFKLAGGQGFAPHQDAPAFTSFGQHYHITMMLSLDASDEANGCLEIAAPVPGGSMLPTNPDLTIADDRVSEMTWQPVRTAPGDVVLFDSYLPHRSGPNTSGKSRRALYATYNRKLEGEVRQQYFEMKRQAFPPDIERKPGVSYDAGVFNVGNPVSLGS